MTQVPVAALLLKWSPMVFIALAASVWFNDVQQGGPWVWRNTAPLAAWCLLGGIALWRGAGRWTANGWQFPLGLIGFAIPALGLSVYLHWAYLTNHDGMFDSGAGDLFRFLPLYTVIAGAIGFGIGWIVGRNSK